MMNMRFGHEAAAAAEGRTPAWLGPLLGAEFYKPCATHPYQVKNECNHYCLDCAGVDDAICCTQCVSAHRNHHIVQIRKSSYHEVIQLAELKAVADVSQVQTYVINYDRVVFLNRRPQAPQDGVKCIGPAGACLECGWGLVDTNFLFCSLSCKLDGMVSDPNITFIVDPRRNREDPGLETEEDDEDEGDDGLPGSSNRPPGWISYRRRPRKGIPERAPFY
ncbi:hypothetical protein CFC21_092311 [Triticum aestivum]|uniref:PLATZ transcription factor family protein n=2 Tax=Triticum aestivum TaxID=4565 RepID=A0A9R1LI68_WHEAT|nr:hypothetical protein CFC21_092311 [Triticum aestivum]